MLLSVTEIEELPIALAAGWDEGIFTQVSSHGIVVCGLLYGGTVECWDAGRDDESADLSPPWDEPLKLIIVGSQHACGLAGNGSPRCWAIPIEIRDSLPQGTLTPERVLAPVPEREEFVALRGNSFHCGLRKDGTVLCWNAFEETETEVSIPMVPEDEVLATIDADFGHLCGLRQDGTPVCWSVDFGPDFTLGADVPEGERFVEISVGNLYACGLRADGTVLCWWVDERAAQELGPMRYPEDERFVAIGSGLNHSCGMREDGSLHCWIPKD